MSIFNAFFHKSITLIQNTKRALENNKQNQKQEYVLCSWSPKLQYSVERSCGIARSSLVQGGISRCVFQCLWSIYYPCRLVCMSYLLWWVGHHSPLWWCSQLAMLYPTPHSSLLGKARHRCFQLFLGINKKPTCTNSYLVQLYQKIKY